MARPALPEIEPEPGITSTQLSPIHKETAWMQTGDVSMFDTDGYLGPQSDVTNSSLRATLPRASIPALFCLTPVHTHIGHVPQVHHPPHAWQEKAEEKG